MFNSSTHRKVALYRALSDETDGNGHGTHCGGSIAGSYQTGALLLVCGDLAMGLLNEAILLHAGKADL